MTGFKRVLSNARRAVSRVGVLTIGSVTGQAVLAVGFILLTNAYSPAELGVLALLLSASRILEIGLSGRAATMVSLHPDIAEVDQIVLATYRLVMKRAVLAMLVAIALSLIFTDLVLLALSVPVFSAVAAIEQLRVQLAIRLGDFWAAARANLVRPSGLILVAAAFTLFDGGAERLILAALLSRLLSMAVLPRVKAKHDVTHELSTRISSFSRKQMPIALASTTNLNMPQIIVGALFGEAASGLYTLGFRIIAAPVTTIGTAVRQVLAREIAQRPGEEAKTISRAALITIPVGILIVVAVLVFSQFIDQLFDDRWAGVGAVSNALALLVGVRFAVAPLSQVLISLDRQRDLLGWHAVNLVIVPASFLIVSEFDGDVVRAVFVYSIALSLSYVSLAVLVWARLTKSPPSAEAVVLLDDAVGKR